MVEHTRSISTPRRESRVHFSRLPLLIIVNIRNEDRLPERGSGARATFKEEEREKKKKIIEN